MKRISIIFWLLSTVFVSIAQNRTDYIRGGDEAMKSKNYSLAFIHYDAVLNSGCDTHSIEKLTEIWLMNESMRAGMNTTMRRCFTCLDNDANQLRDTTSIKLLVKYYAEGIGTDKNEEMATYWQQRLEEIRNPSITMRPNGGLSDERERMQFFAGFHASLIAPFGIQVGGMGKTVGWYVRFRSNLIFQNAPYEGEVINREGQNYLLIPQLEDEGAKYYRTTGNNKITCMMGSAGMMFKAVDNIYVSAGIGYWDRKYMREFIKVSDKGTDIQATSSWASDKNSSKNGVSIELDGMYIISGRFYGTAGASLMDFKYVYPNLGVGFIF